MKKTILVLAMALASSSAVAAPPSTTPVNSGGFYVGANAGSSNVDTGFYDPFGGNIEESGTGYNFHGGYMLNQYIGAEVGYTKYADSVDTNNSNGINYKITTSFYALTLAAKLAYHFDFAPRWSVYGKLGAANMHSTTDATQDAIGTSGSNSKTVTYYELGTGVDLFSHFTINAGFSNADAGSDNATYPYPSASAGMVGDAILCYAGLDYHF